MDHKLAEHDNAVDRYLLDEFTPTERIEFEEHLFDCSICADRVRQDAISIDNLKAVLSEQRHLSERQQPSNARQAQRWFWWLRPPVLIPSLAALALAVLLGYQNFVYIPGLQRPQVLSTMVIAPVARDQGPVIPVDYRLARFNLSFAVDSPQAYSSYQCDFQRDGGPTILTLDSGARQVASFTLDLLLPTKRFPPGRYVMIMRAAADSRTEVARYNFVIQDEGFKN